MEPAGVEPAGRRKNLGGTKNRRPANAAPCPGLTPRLKPVIVDFGRVAYGSRAQGQPQGSARIRAVAPAPRCQTTFFASPKTRHFAGFVRYLNGDNLSP